MIHRIDVGVCPDTCSGRDAHGEAVAKQARALGIETGGVRALRVYLIDAEWSADEARRAAADLLADPIAEHAWIAPDAPPPSAARVEVHLKPGVMDPIAASTELALRDLGLPARQVRTGRLYLFDRPVEQARLADLATRALANPVIEQIFFAPQRPSEFARPAEAPFDLRHVPLRDLDEERLRRLSRDGHLFLSPAEMLAIQAHYRALGREPTDIELETLAQTWSEHCVHKTLKSAVQVRDATGRDLRRYGNLIRETIFEATRRLMEARPPDQPFCLSVFRDNAGVIAFDDADAVCFKVETHNHPSAIEPYGGSATGVGGVVRDVIGTGLAARPLANTDVFCVAFPGRDAGALPRGVIHPRRVLEQVVAGVRDYGNRMGIPTVNGAVFFDDRYVGNPLVFCGCVGLLPRDRVEKQARDGDAIVVLGGRTGRDGIHGATFSSSELTDTHADEFSHAVQIGNAIAEKQMLDVILQARDGRLFTAITDCGAGGLSSAVGEMGADLGAEVDLETVPLKYPGLRYDEIWISEAQERMVLSVPPQHVEALLALAKAEDVEATVIGRFGTPQRDLVLRFRGTEVGRLAMAFLHDGLPMPTRRAIVDPPRPPAPRAAPRAPRPLPPDAVRAALLEALRHPAIASKHWIIRQYDHEVQGGSVIKPLVGPLQIGPSDAAVLRPKPASWRGLALGCGLAPQVEDPYDMAVAAIDEAVRNLVCVGAHPDRMAMLDNFCWPSVDDELTMGTLVRACEACRDAALAYGIPFISGKDSLHNQFVDQETGQVIRIPRTLLISALGVVDDVRRCLSMDLKRRTARVCLVEARDAGDLACLAATHRRVADAIARGQIAAAHDASDGGVFVALAEMCIASGMGIIVGPEPFMTDDAFVERPGRYLLELREGTDADALRHGVDDAALVREIGLVQHLRKITVTHERQRALELSLEELTDAWRGTLDW